MAAKVELICKEKTTTATRVSEGSLETQKSLEKQPLHFTHARNHTQTHYLPF